MVPETQIFWGESYKICCIEGNKYHVYADTGTTLDYSDEGEIFAVGTPHTNDVYNVISRAGVLHQGMFQREFPHHRVHNIKIVNNGAEAYVDIDNFMTVDDDVDVVIEAVD